MSLIEGVGDEVLHFLVLVAVMLMGFAAWLTTYTAELPEIRSIVIVRSTSNATIEQNNSSQQTDGIDTGQIEQNLQQENTVPVNSNNESSKDPNTSSNQPNSRGTVPRPSESNSNTNNTNNVTNETQEQNSSDYSNINNIRIRLKYLNDDQKLVEGRKQELLGDFKRRHFSMELAAQNLVRLIFNGQVLQRDDQTLQGCGLYDNCVVHCLVVAQQNMNRANTQQHSPPADWNLGRLLYTSLLLILGVAWFCRYSYSHLFTLTSSTALVCLTCFFIISLLGYIIPPI